MPVGGDARNWYLFEQVPPFMGQVMKSATEICVLHLRRCKIAQEGLASTQRLIDSLVEIRRYQCGFASESHFEPLDDRRPATRCVDQRHRCLLQKPRIVMSSSDFVRLQHSEPYVICRTEATSKTCARRSQFGSIRRRTSRVRCL